MASVYLLSGTPSRECIAQLHAWPSVLSAKHQPAHRPRNIGTGWVGATASRRSFVQIRVLVTTTGAACVPGRRNAVWTGLMSLQWLPHSALRDACAEWLQRPLRRLAGTRPVALRSKGPDECRSQVTGPVDAPVDAKRHEGRISATIRQLAARRPSTLAARRPSLSLQSWANGLFVR